MIRERHRISWRLLAWLAIPVVSALPSTAAGRACSTDRTVDPAARIAACTRMIETSQGLPGSLEVAYFGRAIARLAQKDLDGAIADYSAVIGISPKSVNAFFGRGLAWSQKGDYHRAIADLDQAIGLDPKNAKIRYSRGFVWSQKGDVAHAIADYARAIELDPKYVPPYIGRGRLWAGKGDDDLAIADDDNAIKLDPNNAGAHNNRGLVWAHKADYGRAIADYDQAIGLDPKFEMSYYNRGMAWARKDVPGGAIADYSQAISLDPKDGSAYFQRGVVYFYSGALPKARADLEQAAALQPDNAYPAIWLDLAERRDGAASHLRDAVGKLDMRRWPAPVVRMLLGEQTPADIRKAVEDMNGTAKTRRLCDADFFAAELSRLQEQNDEARRLYRAALSSCSESFHEYDAAKAGLRELGAIP